DVRDVGTNRLQRLVEVGFGDGARPGAGERHRRLAVEVDNGRDPRPCRRGGLRVMAAHQPSADYDRGGSSRLLQIPRQTVPHRNESPSSSEGDVASIEQTLLRL